MNMKSCAVEKNIEIIISNFIAFAVYQSPWTVCIFSYSYQTICVFKSYFSPFCSITQFPSIGIYYYLFGII